MQIAFQKMNGLGNDFVVLWEEDLKSKAAFIRFKKNAPLICDRHRGVGADQILLLSRPRTSKFDFEMKVLNADGSFAEMCGNGLRAAALEFIQRTRSQKKQLKVQTGRGVLGVDCLPKGHFRAEMGNPKVLGFLKVLGVSGLCVSMGNPHFVIFEPLKGPIESIGPRLECAKSFPKRTNVEWVQLQGRSKIKVDVWERGAGRTLACGTGACASAVAAIHEKRVHSGKVEVLLPGGSLFVQWSGQQNEPVFLTGPAVHVFSGKWNF